MRTIETRIGVLAGLVLSGCAQVASSQVTPSAIYSSYSADYSDESQQLVYKATYTVGGSLGTYVSLDGQSGVTLDGTALDATSDIINQVYYSYAKTAGTTDLTDPHVFVYTDNTGVKYTNVVMIPQDLAVDTPAGAVISTSKSFTVNWSSNDALASSDEVAITLEKSDDTTSAMANDYGTLDTSGQVTFEASRLGPLGIGNFRMQVCRKQWLPVQSGTDAGGDIQINRCLTEIPVTLAE